MHPVRLIEIYLIFVIPNKMNNSNNRIEKPICDISWEWRFDELGNTDLESWSRIADTIRLSRPSRIFSPVLITIFLFS